MESVSNYFLRRQNWRENIFTVKSWTEISVSLPAIRILLRSSTPVVDVENNVRLSSPKTCPFLVAIFQTRNVVFVSRLSLPSFRHLANNEIWLWISVSVNSIPVPTVWYFVEKRRDSRNDWKTIFVRQTASGENNKLFHILCQSDYSESKFFYNYVNCLRTNQVARSY